MAVHKCYAFRLKRKNLLSPTPDAYCPLLALRSIQLMTGKPRPRYSALQLLGESGDCGYIYCQELFSIHLPLTFNSRVVVVVDERVVAGGHSPDSVSKTHMSSQSRELLNFQQCMK